MNLFEKISLQWIQNDIGTGKTKVGLISLSEGETKITPPSKNLCFRWISVDSKYLFISKIIAGYSWKNILLKMNFDTWN